MHARPQDQPEPDRGGEALGPPPPGSSGGSSEEPLEELFDAFMDQALATGGGLDPEEFLDAHPHVSGAARDELLGRLEAISRLAQPILEPAEQDPLAEQDLDRRVGEYRLIRSLGGGAMGEVFLAEQSSLGRLVALKTQRAHLALSPTAAARFEREARALGQVSHPSVVRIHDYGQDGEVAFLAMELLPGRSLKERVDLPRPDEAPPSPAQVTQWGAEVARGLEAVHRVGLVHRDVKPSNLRIVEGEEAERAVLVDFGLARLGESSDLSQTGEFLGSPAYASPEQVRGAAELDGRSDVYSLGATLYQALAGRPPFEGDSLEAVLHGVLSREPVPLARARPGLPRDLCLVVHKAMEKEPAHRYASAAALAEDLEAVLELRPVTAKPQGPLGRALRWARRNRPAAAGLAAASLAVLAALAFVAESARRDRLETRRQAAAFLAEAEENLDAFREARTSLGAEEREFDHLWGQQEYEHLGDERMTRLRQLDAGVRSAREQRDQLFVATQNLLDSARRLDPRLEPAVAEVGAGLILERLLEAQDRGDAAAEAFLTQELGRRDTDGSLRKAAYPYARVTLASAVPGTRAWVQRRVPLDELVEGGEWRQVPVPMVPTGTGDRLAPWPQAGPAEPPLPWGSEVLRLTAAPLPHLGLRTGDLITHLEGFPIGGGPFVRSVAPTPILGEPAVQVGDRLVALDGRPLTDPLEVEALLLAEPEVEHRFSFQGPPRPDGGARMVELSHAAVRANGVLLEDAAARLGRLGGWARVVARDGVLELELPAGLSIRRSLAAPLLLTELSCPLERDLGLEPGSYLVVTEAPGHPPTRHTLLLAPGQRHELDVTPTPAGQAPDGFVHVQALTRDDPPFWYQEHEVTSAEYLAFLNEPAQLAAVDASLRAGRGRLFPRTSSQSPDAAMWPRGADGRFELPADWPPTWPVLGVTRDDARAYCAWRTGRAQGGRFVLPERGQTALAGAGGANRYSWGSRFDQRFANTCFSRAVARPEPVLANPRDESPFGVYDTCGNALEWVEGWYDESRSLLHAIGGSWGQARLDTLAVEGGLGLGLEASGGETGFRMVWVPPDTEADGER